MDRLEKKERSEVTLPHNNQHLTRCGGRSRETKLLSQFSESDRIMPKIIIQSLTPREMIDSGCGNKK